MTQQFYRPIFTNLQPRKDLTAEYVRTIINYDPETGIIWHKPRPIREECPRHDRAWNERYAVPKPRMSDPRLYPCIRIDGISYRAHRIAWLHYYGKWPEGLLDHRNGNRADMRIENLREATSSTNAMNSARRSNNSSGCKGVDYMPRKGVWRARIGCRGINIFLGLYATAEEAASAYRQAAEQLHGDFARVE